MSWWVPASCIMFMLWFGQKQGHSYSLHYSPSWSLTLWPDISRQMFILCILNVRTVLQLKTYLTLNLSRQSKGWATPEMCCHSGVFFYLWWSCVKKGFKNWGLWQSNCNHSNVQNKSARVVKTSCSHLLGPAAALGVLNNLLQTFLTL